MNPIGRFFSRFKKVTIPGGFSIEFGPAKVDPKYEMCVIGYAWDGGVIGFDSHNCHFMAMREDKVELPYRVPYRVNALRIQSIINEIKGTLEGLKDMDHYQERAITAAMEPQPSDPKHEEAFNEMVKMLMANGWEFLDNGSKWYQRRFRHRTN